MKKSFSLILLVILVILIVVFTLQNSENVSVKFFSVEFISSLSLVIFLTLTFGIVIAILALSPSMLKDRKLRKTLRKKIKNLEKEIEKHKARVKEDAQKELKVENVKIDENGSDNIYYKQ